MCDDIDLLGFSSHDICDFNFLGLSSSVDGGGEHACKGVISFLLLIYAQEIIDEHTYI